MGYQQTAESGFSARRRHLEALHQAEQYLEHGRNQLTLMGAGELLAEPAPLDRVKRAEPEPPQSAGELY